ncbi:hypothetical protein [Wohlfahrtiimonas sp. G9077]|uniref:hypothetical protein n=1 Tax=Wohlfahrtiimonas sp. G9077 TaxID=1980118 RepID=UPI000B99B2C4|nr:hypothetical protein [Wohlfahrtiimonas sp. G9077]OYQ75217.1 hypothetical protein B9T20_00545 [Wohlfahrtiimonas sp. G9077]
MKERLRQLNQFYLPPLTKLYFERAALEKIVNHVPLFVRISDPESWLMQSAHQMYRNLSKEALSDRLDQLIDYLTTESTSVFEGQQGLVVHDSVPYIEWRMGQKFYATSDLLGKPTLFMDLQDLSTDSEQLSKNINHLQSVWHDQLQIVLMGETHTYPAMAQYENLILMDPTRVTHPHFVERFRFKPRNLSMFSFGSKPFFLMNSHGKLMSFFSKQDQSVLVEEVKKQLKL